MKNLATQETITAGTLDTVMIKGDLSVLSDRQRVEYYGAVCKSVGLNPLTKPFEYIQLNGKLTLYALRAATDQLRNVHKVSINITARENIEGVYVVTAKAKNGDGREDESTGAVNVQGLKGESLANAYMKAETKAKRRVTLSICGLGLLDESEVESIPGAAPGEPKDVSPRTSPKEVLEDMKNERDAIEKDPSQYVATFGKYRGKKLAEIDPYELEGYVKYIEEKAVKDGKDIVGKVAEFVSHSKAWFDRVIEPPAALDTSDEIPDFMKD
jgi:hypothetical protein